MRFLAVLTAAVVLATAAPAHADWQWTKWGMTRDEVIAASGGKAVYDSNHILRLPDPWVVQGCPFQVYFTFDENNKLFAVILTADRDCYSEMALALTTLYGEPISADSNSKHYADLSKGNSISLLSIGGETMIKYLPLPSGL